MFNENGAFGRHFLCGVWVDFYWQAVEEISQVGKPYFQASCSEVYLEKVFDPPSFFSFVRKTASCLRTG